jgi:hypothetical protein
LVVVKVLLQIRVAKVVLLIQQVVPVAHQVQILVVPELKKILAVVKQLIQHLVVQAAQQTR